MNTLDEKITITKEIITEKTIENGVVTKEKVTERIIKEDDITDIDINNDNKAQKNQSSNFAIQMNAIKSVINIGYEIFEKSHACSNEPSYTIMASRKSPIHELSKARNTADEIVSPLVLPYYDTKSEFTGLYIMALAKIGRPLSKEDLKFQYNFTLSAAGNAQLNVYISFNYLKNKSETPKNIDFWYNVFDLHIGCESMLGIDLRGVTTVSVFLIDKDPETTRGTVTTVMPPVKDSPTEGQ